MPPPVTWTVNEHESCLVVAVRGELSSTATEPLHTALMKCLAEQPEALLIDLAGATAGSGPPLTIFAAVTRQAAMWPGTPVLLCAPVGALTPGRADHVQVHSSLAAALLTVAAGQVAALSIVDELLPLSGTARHARDIVTDACTRWGLSHLIGPASLVASELVTNAIEHAGTMMTFRVTLRDHYVHLAVHDGSTGEPKMGVVPNLTGEGGRGLRLVDSMATHWGWLPSNHGKVVWAVIARES